MRDRIEKSECIFGGVHTFYYLLWRCMLTSTPQGCALRSTVSRQARGCMNSCHCYHHNSHLQHLISYHFYICEFCSSSRIQSPWCMSPQFSTSNPLELLTSSLPLRLSCSLGSPPFLSTPTRSSSCSTISSERVSDLVTVHYFIGGRVISYGSTNRAPGSPGQSTASSPIGDFSVSR